MANTNAKGKLYICPVPQNQNLTQEEFEGLEWVRVRSMGNHGQTGPDTNLTTYDTWDDEVTQKAKGMTNAGDPEIEVARLPTDPGQIAMREAAKANDNYAFKLERNDVPAGGGTPTINYNRGLVTGPRNPNGRNEDFDLETYTLGLNQLQITVDPVPAAG